MIYALHIFSLICGLYFHFLNDVFWWEENFNIDEIQFFKIGIKLFSLWVCVCVCVCVFGELYCSRIFLFHLSHWMYRHKLSYNVFLSSLMFVWPLLLFNISRSFLILIIFMWVYFLSLMLLAGVSINVN